MSLFAAASCPVSVRGFSHVRWNKSRTDLPQALMNRGRTSRPCPCLHKTNEKWETAVPCSQLHDWLSHTYANRVGSVVLPRQGVEHALSRVAAAGIQGFFSYSYYHRSALLAFPGADYQPGRNLTPFHVNKTDEKLGLLSHAHNFRPGSLRQVEEPVLWS